MDYNDKLEVLNLSQRAYNCLRRAGIDTVGQLASTPESKLRLVKNLGQKSLDEIKEALITHPIESGRPKPLFAIDDKVRVWGIGDGIARIRDIEELNGHFCYLVTFPESFGVWVDENEIEPVVTCTPKPKKKTPPRPDGGTVMKEAIQHYGKNYQMTKALEELSELAKEICKWQIGKGDIAHLTEEMGDVYIILYELQEMLGIRDESLHEWQEKKFTRLWEEMHKEDN